MALPTLLLLFTSLNPGVEGKGGGRGGGGGDDDDDDDDDDDGAD